MANKVKVGFAILDKTADDLVKIQEQTFRSKSDIIDWLVAEYMKQHPELVPQPQTTPQSNTLSE